jgi:hypothetical protein
VSKTSFNLLTDVDLDLALCLLQIHFLHVKYTVWEVKRSYALKSRTFCPPFPPVCLRAVLARVFLFSPVALLNRPAHDLRCFPVNLFSGGRGAVKISLPHGQILPFLAPAFGTDKVESALSLSPSVNFCQLPSDGRSVRFRAKPIASNPITTPY